MISHYLDEYDKKYSITSGGDVISHYHLTKNGGRFYQHRVLIKAVSPTHSSARVTLTSKPNAKGTLKYVVLLMAKHFDLTPPDEYHGYCLKPKDRNPYNTELNNLHWVIKTKTDYSFQPKCFHKKGKITHKICGSCGDKKKIDCYILNERLKYRTYINICKLCTNIRQASEKGKSYRRRRGQKGRDNLDGWYINLLIRASNQNPECYTKEMKDCVKIIAQIKRKIKLQS